MIIALIIAMHPRRWLKNLFMFSALVFGMKLVVPSLIVRALVAFFCLCLLSSAAYLINDVVDAERDKLHPRKRDRPLPSGRLKESWALGGAIVLALVSLAVAVVVDYRFALTCAVFIVVEIGYSLLFTRFVVLDVLAIAAAFILRVMAGSVVAGATNFSPWLYVCGSFLALFMALCKRRQELIVLGDLAPEHREVLADYGTLLLVEMIAVVTSSTVIAYSLYTFWGAHVPENKGMMLTIPFVLYGVFRYLLLMQRPDLPGSPEEMLIRDPPLVINNLLWGGAVLAILYWF
ncbi:MAG: decaprenyl-phosphate phosphoribosyltransferase [Anaerolineae bacterium]|nr:decaprenyl-phosphate phosphoribosyltransferase [Anaerolineae bacterium]NIN97881.1 decaprenyl-phosphate phosphoribosyltransferase [Anaerolineae bacterium]NIQ80860.1 decaprenyl-phosphate phosphoribosyltransferase [Anaerolineae bacterium]